MRLHRAHRRLAWTLGAVFGVLSGVLAAGLLFLTLFDWNRLRPALSRLITADTGRPAAIDGDLHVHLWSWNPSAEVNGLRIMNPSWADRGLMFGARRITVSLSLARLLRGQVVLSRVDLSEPQINLERDSRGRASWELGSAEGSPNRNARPVKLPVVRSLTIEDGRVQVEDHVRHLVFSGTLVATEQLGQESDSALKMRSSGSLNSKPFRLDANGGPLFDLEPHKPYAFTASVTAADIKLETRVTVRKPFDLAALDVQFVVSGNDLAEAYYLTGLALPNTPHYRLAATMHVDGTWFIVDNLKGRLGSSDLAGRVQVDTAGERPKLTAQLTSAALDLADLAAALGEPSPQANSLDGPSPAAPAGMPAHAAVTLRNAARGIERGIGRGDERGVGRGDGQRPEDGRWLLPDADLQVNRVRGMDADVTYQADSVIASSVPMKGVTFHLTLQDGLLRLAPLAFVLDEGRFHGSVQIDARVNPPVSEIDMRMEDVDLSQFKPGFMKQAPLKGTMLGRFKFHGAGSSVHKFAAGSDGSMSVVIPQGRIDQVMAELTGVNVLHALGLLLSKNHIETGIRCGVVDLKDENGRLDATTVYLDTSTVLITGRGSVDLDSEAVDLSLQGDSKRLRFLRLRAPIRLQGTLRHPTVGIRLDKLAEQTGIAAALGVLLTPPAAAIAFIDPGLAKDKDCSTVLEQAKAGVREVAGLRPP